MIHDFYALKVVKCQKETNDTINIGFEIPQALRHIFTFKQGQYLNVRFLRKGEDLRRSYSIINAPFNNDGILEVLVKHIKDGEVSSYINNELKLGDNVEVLAPQGHFYTNHHPSNQRTYIGLAAGSGISPVLSNLVEALHEEPKSNAFLIFGNKTLHDIIFKERIDGLVAQFKGRLKVVYLLSREKHFENELFEGRICPEKLDQLFDYFPEIKVQESTYFLCGPIEMIKSMAKYLKEDKKVPSLQVLYEYYLPPEEVNAEHSDEFKKIPNIESFVTIILDDDEYSVHLNSKKESILQKAINEHMPVPFSCQNAVCCTCKAKVLEGEVFMEKNYALTEEEVAEGYILTCQSHPVTNVVMITYDV